MAGLPAPLLAGVQIGKLTPVQVEQLQLLGYRIE